MIILSGIPNCDTVKKARLWLGEHDTEYRFRDFKKEPPTAAELAQWADAVGWETLLNKRGTTFRGLADGDKAGIDRAKAIRLMEAQPSLIKRPVVTGGAGKVTVGFSEKSFAQHWS
jgi:arsenate reductase